MLETMYVRCAHCGYDNSPEYRFCGMCGASLAHSVPPKPAALSENPVPARAETEPTETVHGPSFLGLADDPKVEFHYLYEDEQPKSHLGLVLFLLILLGGGGLLVWQWRNNGYPFNRVSSANSAPTSASPSEVTPAPNQDQQTHTAKPMTGVGDQPAATPEQKKQPEAKDKAGQAAGEQNANPAPKEEDIPPKGESASPKSGVKNSESNNQTAAAEEKPAEEEAKATPPSVPEKAAHPTPRPHAPNPKAVAPPPPPSTSTTGPDSDLEVIGERYLYGTGLPQNCARAESNLRAAALHNNAKAQTVLGTMYATGHCVGRDLPTAYRWFGRALQLEPQNSRIAADLQVLWRQMTPQEKQLAMASHK